MNAPELIPLQVNVEHPPAQALARGAQSAMDMVQAFEVVDDGSYTLAGEELQGIKSRATKLEDQRKAITKPMDDAKKAVMDLFRGPLELLGQAEAALKGKMLAYSQEQVRKAAEERRKAEEAAAAERARLATEAAKLEAEGKTGEAAVQRQVADMVVAQPSAVAAPVKVAGVKTTTTVDFEVVDLHRLVMHAAEHPEVVALLQVDSVKLRAYVRGLGMATKLPGVRVFEKQGIAAARR